jgi:hypothetical protein
MGDYVFGGATMLVLGTLTDLRLDGDDDHIAVVDDLPQRKRTTTQRLERLV